MTAGLGGAAWSGRSAFVAADALPPEVKTSLGAPIGLQLYSLREYAPKDLGGTLTRLRALGIVEVESAGLYDKDVATVRAALDKAGLRCSGSHIGYDRWQKDAAGAVKEAKGLGARFATARTRCAPPRSSTRPARRVRRRASASATTATGTSSCRRPRARCGTPS
jgi:hypothetical protein